MFLKSQQRLDFHSQFYLILFTHVLHGSRYTNNSSLFTKFVVVILHGLDSVSYTHLDVYKRQKWKRKHYITKICLPATNDILFYTCILTHT